MSIVSWMQNVTPGLASGTTLKESATVPKSNTFIAAQRAQKASRRACDLPARIPDQKTPAGARYSAISSCGTSVALGFRCRSK